MISNVLLDYVCDGDEHAKLASVEYSTDLREIVTVSQMIKYGERGEIDGLRKAF